MSDKAICDKCGSSKHLWCDSEIYHLKQDRANLQLRVKTLESYLWEAKQLVEPINDDRKNMMDKWDDYLTKPQD